MQLRWQVLTLSTADVATEWPRNGCWTGRSWRPSCQFDVTTGQALNHPIPEYIDEPLPGRWAEYASHFGVLMQQVSVRNIKTFLVTIEKESIQVQLD